MESGIGAASISVCCQQRHRDTGTQRHRDMERHVMESGIGAASISVCCQQRHRDTETQRHGEACDGEWNRSSLHLCVLSTER